MSVPPSPAPALPASARARRRAAGPALAACAMLLAACGSASSTSSVNAAAGTASTAGPPATATTVTRTVTASGSSTPPASGTGAPAACTASSLTLRFLGQQGATGHGELGFAVRNTGTRACRTLGYPGVQFLSVSGAPLPTRSQRTTTDFFGAAPEAAIVLAPGASASFRLGVSHGNASSAGCTTAHGLQVFPPDDTAILRAAIAQGAYECGTVTVSPMRPGTSAYTRH